MTSSAGPGGATRAWGLEPDILIIGTSIAGGPRNGTESAAGADPALEDLIHLYLLNRGISLTPFHNMALMSPVTTTTDVELHHGVFRSVIAELLGG